MTRFATEKQWQGDGNVYPKGDLLVILPEGFMGTSGSFPYRLADGIRRAANIVRASGNANFTLPSGTSDGLTNAELRAAPVVITQPTIPVIATEITADAILTQLNKLTFTGSELQVTSSGGGGGLVDQGAAGVDPWLVEVSNFPTTQPVSGPLTDTQLRASAVPVSISGTIPISGTVNQGTAGVDPWLVDTGLVQPTTPSDTQPVSGTFWQATQPVSGPLTDAELRAADVLVSATALPLPIGASTSALQTTGNTTLSSILTALSSVPVTGPLTDTELRAMAVPVSVSSIPLPTGAATAANQATEIASLANLDVALSTRLKAADTLAAVTTVGAITNVVHVDDNGDSLTVDTPQLPTTLGAKTTANSVAVNVASDQTVAISAVSLPLPTGAATNSALTTINTTLGTPFQAGGSIGNTTFASTQSGTWTVQPGNTANTTAWKVDASSVAVPLAAGSALIGKVGIDQTTPGTTNNVTVSSITPPTLTKGTQSGTGFSIQELKDAGRTSLRYYATTAAAGTTTTETAISLTRSSGTAATSAAVSWAPSSGKTFRIQAIMFATRGNSTATIQTTTFNLRINTGGAVTTSSTPIVLSARCATPATASAWDRVFVEIPDGYEIAGDGTLQFGVTAAATYTTNAPTWDVLIVGYEY